MRAPQEHPPPDVRLELLEEEAAPALKLPGLQVQAVRPRQGMVRIEGRTETQIAAEREAESVRPIPKLAHPSGPYGRLSLGRLRLNARSLDLDFILPKEPLGRRDGCAGRSPRD